jgi:poly(3-hydroxybutyrate) depolymerase
MYTTSSYQLLDSSIKFQKLVASSYSALFDQNPSLTKLYPFGALMNGWSKVAEKSFDRMSIKPEWAVEATNKNGTTAAVLPEVILHKPFCALTRFCQPKTAKNAPKILIVAPMSGHYATLVRNTVSSLVTEGDIYVTDWKNARDVPPEDGIFDVDSFVDYLVEFIECLGADTHVMAICQPAPLTAAAAAYIAEHNPKALPKSLTLMGGPVDPSANPSAVTDYAEKANIAQLQYSVIMPVEGDYAGAGRLVYPGIVQLTAFMSMNANTHLEAFVRQIGAESEGNAHDDDRHNRFYNEYLSVMDMPAEFFLSTVERIFKNREIATNRFQYKGAMLDLNKVKDTRLLIIEGGRDDISAPGQCKAALSLFGGIDDQNKHYILQDDAGHYGIFSGRAWRNSIKPQFLDFIKRR